MLKMNPDIQIAAGKNVERAHFGNAPTLAIMRKAYGDTFPGSWLAAQITDLALFSNSNGLLNGRQVEYLAEAIMQEYYYLKASEILLFMYRFKMGRYGKFYGVVDPMLIMQGLETFVGERQSAIIAKEEADKKAERDSWAASALKPAEYCRQHGLPETDSVVEVVEMITLRNFVVDLLWKIDAVWVCICKCR